MKRRDGFVSNSSSSSFIVILPRRPESVQEVESLFFPNGFDDSYWADEDEHVTATELAEVLWRDILDQRKIPDVVERVMRMCNDNCYTRDMGDALGTMEVSREEAAKLLPEGTYQENVTPEFIHLALDKARRQGAAVHRFPEHDTTEVYCLAYGSGCGAAEQAMFNNTDFLEHLPFVLVMES